MNEPEPDAGIGTQPCTEPTTTPRWWYDIDLDEAVNLVLPTEGIEGPVDEEGNPRPWPWEPQQLRGVPLGQYHCGYCGAMVLAGWPHPDYADADPPGDGP